MFTKSTRRYAKTTLIFFLVLLIIGLTIAVFYLSTKKVIIEDSSKILKENTVPVVEKPVDGLIEKKPEQQTKSKISPAPIENDIQIIAESLPTGSTFEVRRKSVFVGKGRDRDWSNPDEIVLIGIYVENLYKREIEKNDGTTLVEVRTILQDRVVKVLSPSSNIQFSLKKPTELHLDKIELLEKGILFPLLDEKKSISSIFEDQSFAQKSDLLLYKLAGKLEGKKVRLTSVQGKGVISVEPIDCKLNASERQGFFNKDPMALFSTVLKTDIKQKEKIVIPGFMFREAFELVEEDEIPFITGFVIVDRLDDLGDADNKLAKFLIRKKESSLSLKEEDKDSKILMNIIPEGEIIYSFKNKCVQEMLIFGDFEIKAKPKGKGLEKSVLIDQPVLKLTYSCLKK